MTGILDQWQVSGRTRSHVLQFSLPRFAAQAEAAEAFLALRDAARADGFDLTPCASFRPFEAQLRNWNRKASGNATLHDRHGGVRDYAAMTPAELIYAILGWTALPGASRRHWGSDIDVYDRAAVPPGYRLKLLPEELERARAALDIDLLAHVIRGADMVQRELVLALLPDIYASHVMNVDPPLP